MKARPILWQPTEKQREFLACPAREVLFAGSVGSGKTDALLMAALSQVKNPKHQALILRRSFPMLRDMIGRGHELFLPLGASFIKQESVFIFPSNARVEFGFIDADEDKYRFMGRSFSTLCWDELTSWPGDNTNAQGNPVNSAYVYMLSRLRAVEGSGLRLECRATCTPGGIGHNFVKARWGIPNDGSSSEVIDPQTGYRRVFIRATIKDNPYLANTEYARSLEALPAATKAALLEGRWDVFEGAVFSEWNPTVHVCEPFAIPVEWKIWRGADDGFASQAAILWLARHDIHDRIYCVAELYQRGMNPRDMAEAVRRIDAGILRSVGHGHPHVANGPKVAIGGILDSASWATTGASELSRAEQMNALGCGWTPCTKGAGSRVAGISEIHARLAMKDDGKGPGLVVFNTCRNLIRTLPSLTYSKAHPEDIADECEQHLCDALKYGIQHKPPVSKRVSVHF